MDVASNAVEAPQTYNIENVEIFEAGKWNGEEYTEKDLDDIVSSFNEIGGKIKPFVKLGHSEKQDLLQKDGLPAAGWITGLKRVGSKLVANFSSVPEKIYQLIKANAYGRFSSEIFWNLKDEGKTYRRVLRAVALLGADTPAVTSLDDFINLYTESEYDKLTVCTTKEDIMDIDVKKYEMEIETLQTQLKKYEMDMSEKDKELSAKEEIIKNYEAEKVAAFTREVESTIDAFVAEGKITPAQKENLVKLCANVEQFDQIKQFMANQGEVVPMGEKSAHVEIDRSEKTPDEILDEKIMAYAAEHKVSYADAFSAIARQEGGQ